MKSLLKIFTILTPQDICHCALLGGTMLIGAFMEAVGVGAILPFLSIMGQPDYLEQHEMLAIGAGALGVASHSQLIMAGALGLLLLYILKNGFLAYMTKCQVDFSLRLQVNYARQLYANYLLKPYLYHLDHNTATILRNMTDGPVRIFTIILNLQKAY